MREFVLIQTFFLTLHSMKIHFCTTISIVRRSNFSSCMRMISDYDFYFIIWDRSILPFVSWNRSYRNYQMKLIIIWFRKKSWSLRSLEKMLKGWKSPSILLAILRGEKVDYSYLYAMDYLLCVMKSFRRRSSHLRLVARDLLYIHSYESQLLTLLFWWS